MTEKIIYFNKIKMEIRNYERSERNYEGNQ